MAKQSNTPPEPARYTEKGYYKARKGEVINVMFRDTTGYQGRLVGTDKHHIFVESVTTAGDVVMIAKDTIQYVGPAVSGS